MTYEEDLELAMRLRRISADPEPEMPASLYRFADQVVEGPMIADAGTQNVPSPIAIVRGGWSARPSPVRALAGLAAAFVVALAAGTFLFAVQRGGPAASQSFAPDEWTGLEWHDITATSGGLFKADAWFSGQTRLFVSVVAFNGRFFAVDNDGMSTSLDARTWTRVPGAPALTWLGVLNGELVGQGIAVLPAPWASWTSTDGVTWQSHVESFAGPNDGMGSWVTTSTAGLVDVQRMSTDTPSAAAAPTAPAGNGASSAAPALTYADHSFYVTTDGISWRKGALPTDIPGLQDVQFFSGGDVFVMEAMADDPTYRPDPQSHDVAQAVHLWTSRDGQSWTRVSTSALGEFFGVPYVGSLGVSVPPIVSNGFHSADGVNWTKDQDKISIVNNANMGSSTTLSVQADGRHILVSADWNEQFSVSRGDGHWRTLQQGGDIGSLPGGGQPFLLPDGVLYAGGGRLFYGQALVGTKPSGDLHPAATITPAPTPTPAGYTPRPVETPAPATNWTGLSSIANLATGPAGATSITRWTRGYIAIRDASTQDGTLTAWTSPDGTTWTKIPDGTFGSHPTAEAAQDGDQVVLATWGGSVGVWASTDGLHWSQAAISGPPIGGRGMAGTSAGVVALMDDPQNTLFSDMGNSVILNTGINSFHGIAVAGHRWVIVGQGSGTNPATGPAAWSSDDGVSWSQAFVESAPGVSLAKVVAGRDGFVALGSGPAADSAPTLWTSPDGQAWHRDSGDLPNLRSVSFTGDGTHILGFGVGSSGKFEVWASLDGQAWTKLALAGDTSALLSNTDITAYALGDGVLLVTPDGAWYSAASMRN